MKKDLSSIPLCPARELVRITDDIKGKNVIVVGLGLFGGGAGAAGFFCKLGAKVTVTDLKSETELAPAVSRLSELPIRFRFGSHSRSDLLSGDLIVLNPAVPRDSQVVAFIREAGIPMTSPMNVFLARCTSPVVAVTGSVGKSTTTAMLHEMLTESGFRVHMGGNMGISMLPSLDRIAGGDIVLLELSSVQLEDAAALPFSPHVAVVTNILPNHLDLYGSFERYAAAKKNIIKFQGPDDLAVLNREDRIMSERWAPGLNGKLLFFDGRRGPKAGGNGAFLCNDDVVWQDNGRSEVLFSAHDLTLPGRHNLKNAIAAAAAARWLGAQTKDISRALNRFRTLEHRLEKCARINGITFYNDSDSTTPDSTIAAIDSFPTPITLICGGKDKGFCFAALAAMITEKVDVLITLGQCGPLIAQLTREAGAAAGAAPVIKEAVSLTDAVKKAFKNSMPGSTVLFSPACSSYDMFQNFAERGREFKNIVQDIKNCRGGTGFPQRLRPGHGRQTVA